MNINHLKSLLVRNISIDDLIGSLSELKALAKTYVDLEMEIPDWVVLKIGDVEAETNSQVRAERQAELKKIESRLEALKSPSEVKKELSAQRDRLLSSLK